MGMPSKSANAFACVALSVLFASIPSGEVFPNTVLTSAGMLSNSILAVEKPPTSQPARVNGTQGEGGVLPFWLIIGGGPSARSPPQYRNDVWKPTEPSAWKKP